MLADIPGTSVVMEIADYLKKHKVSLERFAMTKNIYLHALKLAISEDRLFVFGTDLYYKSTQYSPSLVLGKKPVPIKLSEHISESFGGDFSAFAEKHGDNILFVRAAVERGGLWVAREVLLPYSLPSAYPVISIQAHIEAVFDDNATEFGRKHNKSQQQVHRWKSKNAGWCLGNVYLRRTEFNPDIFLDDRPRQAVLFQDYLFGGYFLPAQERLTVMQNTTTKERQRALKRIFKEMYVKYSNQIDRYIAYPNTMWIEGDIYKKQTDFETTVQPVSAAG